MTSATFSLGLDFGTTNSVASLPVGDGGTRPVVFPRSGVVENSFPSLLTFWQEEVASGEIVTRAEGGQWAIDAFREQAPDCRFLKSIKSFAASSTFTSTMVYGMRVDFVSLMKTFLTTMRQHASPKTGWDTGSVVIGRPVRFAGVGANEQVAMERYRTALRALGFNRVSAIYEPLAAAYHFVRDLRGDATIFVGDLGGGTSDYSIIKVSRRHGRVSMKSLASQGLGIAGDQLDYRIIQNTIAPALGRGSEYLSFGKRLEVPGHYFNQLAQWHELSRLRGSDTFREIKALRAKSLALERLDRLIKFIDAEMQYELFAAVSEAKQTLSTGNTAHLRLKIDNEVVESTFTRDEFDGWIAPDLRRLDELIDKTLHESGLREKDIDTVFLTGGTSFVPAIRQMFERRFGYDTIESSDQLISVANGLALIAGDGAAEDWMAEST